MNIFIWFQEDKISPTGKDASIRESTMYTHACFLIKSMSQRDEHIREISAKLLIHIWNKFPQVGINDICWLLPSSTTLEKITH